MLAGRADLLEVLALPRVDLGLQQQVGHADHGVHRRPDLVAHVGEEIGLRARGLLGEIARAPRLLEHPVLGADVLEGRDESPCGGLLDRERLRGDACPERRAVTPHQPVFGLERAVEPDVHFTVTRAAFEIGVVGEQAGHVAAIHLLLVVAEHLPETTVHADGHEVADHEDAAADGVEDRLLFGVRAAQGNGAGFEFARTLGNQVLEAIAALRQLSLRLLEIGDVAQRRVHHRGAVDLDQGQGHLGEEGLPVTALHGPFETQGTRALQFGERSPGLGDGRLTVRLELRREVTRHEAHHVLHVAHAELRERSLVRRDAAAVLEQHHGLPGVLEQHPEALLALAQALRARQPIDSARDALRDSLEQLPLLAREGSLVPHRSRHRVAHRHAAMGHAADADRRREARHARVEVAAVDLAIVDRDAGHDVLGPAPTGQHRLHGLAQDLGQRPQRRIGRAEDRVEAALLPDAIREQALGLAQVARLAPDLGTRHQ